MKKIMIALLLTTITTAPASCAQRSRPHDAECEAIGPNWDRNTITGQCEPLEHAEPRPPDPPPPTGGVGPNICYDWVTNSDYICWEDVD